MFSRTLCLLLAFGVRAISAEHVVLIVWDGMRPDFITPEYTPTLHALAQSGTFFAANHSVYITSTEVNGAAIATGCYPNKTGIMANREYRPDIDATKPIDTQAALAIRKGDELSGGKWIARPTLAEIVQASGARTAVAGTKPVALLHDRQFNRAKSNGSVVLFAGSCYPAETLPALTAALGDFPEYPILGLALPNSSQNAWTTRALTEVLWKDGVPRFSTLWLGDPDFSQHLTWPGSPVALAAIKNSDTNLAAVLAALEAKGVRAKTDVFIVSDHGFSTSDRVVDLMALLKAAGFNAAREFKAAPQAGDILVSALGGSVSCYIIGHDEAVLHPQFIVQNDQSLADIWRVLTEYKLRIIFDGDPVERDWFCSQDDLFDVNLIPF